jgi:predicted porin
MGSPGFNYRSSAYSIASDTTTKGFDIRAQNSVAYHSPKVSGLSAKLQYSANEFKSARGGQNPELYSGVVNFDYGPLSVFGAVDVHQDGFALAGINGGTTAASRALGSTAANTVGADTAPLSETDYAWRAGAGYELAWIGTTTISGTFEMLQLKQDHAPAGAIKKYERNAYQVALKHRYGDHELRARWNQAEDGSVTLNGAGGSTTGYGASEIAVGYAYYFAKTFQMYLSFAQITNAKNAQYTVSIGGSPAVAGATPKGADPMAVGLGLRYAF